MARTTSKTQLEIFEVKTDDGGTGLQFGNGPVFMGYDAGDLMRLLGAVFHDATDDEPLDGDLLEIAEQYLDETTASERKATLERWANGDYDDEGERELLDEYFHGNAWDAAKGAF